MLENVKHEQITQDFVVDHDAFPLPREMPSFSRKHNGILHVDFGHVFITPAHMMHLFEARIKMFGNEKMPALYTFEAAGVPNKSKPLLNAFKVLDITAAIGLVCTTKMGTIVSDLYINILKPKYPVRLFDNVADAESWLKNYL